MGLKVCFSIFFKKCKYFSGSIRGVSRRWFNTLRLVDSRLRGNDKTFAGMTRWFHTLPKGGVEPSCIQWLHSLALAKTMESARSCGTGIPAFAGMKKHSFRSRITRKPTPVGADLRVCHFPQYLPKKIMWKP